MLGDPGGLQARIQHPSHLVMSTTVMPSRRGTERAHPAVPMECVEDLDNPPVHADAVSEDVKVLKLCAAPHITVVVFQC